MNLGGGRHEDRADITDGVRTKLRELPARSEYRTRVRNSSKAGATTRPGGVEERGGAEETSPGGSAPCQRAHPRGGDQTSGARPDRWPRPGLVPPGWRLAGLGGERRRPRRTRHGLPALPAQQAVCQPEELRDQHAVAASATTANEDWSCQKRNRIVTVSAFRRAKIATTYTSVHRAELEGEERADCCYRNLGSGRRSGRGVPVITRWW